MSKQFLEKSFPNWLDEYLRLYPFSGTVRITHRDEVLFERSVGLADREWGIPIDRDTRFRLYSLTKPFTAIGLMLLVEAGKLDLDSHPGKYVKGAEKLHKAVTVRSLLNHSSGLPDFRQWKEFREKMYAYPVDKARLLEAMSGLPMNFETGKSTYYGNFNFFLASLIAEELTGMRFSEYIQDRVFAPLGMKTACIEESEKIIANKAKGYDVNGREIVQAPMLRIDWMMGAGCGVGTVDDVYRLNREIKEKRLLSEESWHTILTPVRGSMGLGCSATKWNGHTRYTHNGGYYGFRTLHVQMPEDDLDIIILSNTGFGNFRMAFSEAILRMFYDGSSAVEAQPEMDKGFARQSAMLTDVLKPQRPEIENQDASEFSGKYETATTSTVVDIQGNKGEILLNGWQRMPVYYIGNGVFQHEWIDENYMFSIDENGKMKFGEMTRIG